MYQHFAVLAKHFIKGVLEIVQTKMKKRCVHYHGQLNKVSFCNENSFGVYLLDFFCSGIQFYALLSPYLCFISFLKIDLYVLGDDALIS